MAVLVHRIRKEFTQVGFEHRFLEKERKIIRARLIDIEILGSLFSAALAGGLPLIAGTL
ncbi:MAG: hypothetical protein ACI8RZ_002308 [Myxococcota bacterium]|jgi:hypothetical protein